MSRTAEKTIDNWYWAARADKPAGDHFIIENGKMRCGPASAGKLTGMKIVLGCLFID